MARFNSVLLLPFCASGVRRLLHSLYDFQGGWVGRGKASELWLWMSGAATNPNYHMATAMRLKITVALTAPVTPERLCGAPRLRHHDGWSMSGIMGALESRAELASTHTGGRVCGCSCWCVWCTVTGGRSSSDTWMSCGCTASYLLCYRCPP